MLSRRIPVIRLKPVAVRESRYGHNFRSAYLSVRSNNQPLSRLRREHRRAHPFPIELIQLKAPTQPYMAPKFAVRESLTKPSTPILAAQHSSHTEKRLDMNREFLRRLRLLSMQTKREMDMRSSSEGRSRSAPKDAIPEFNKETLQIVAKKIKLSELQALSHTGARRTLLRQHAWLLNIRRNTWRSSSGKDTGANARGAVVNNEPL